jgi:hypothetical protein
VEAKDGRSWRRVAYWASIGLALAGAGCGQGPHREQKVEQRSSTQLAATADWIVELGLRVNEGNSETDAKEPSDTVFDQGDEWVTSRGKASLAEVLELEGPPGGYEESYLVWNGAVNGDRLKSAFFSYRRLDSRNQTFGQLDRRVASQDGERWFVGLTEILNADNIDADPGDLHRIELDLHFDSGTRRRVDVDLRLLGAPAEIQVDPTSESLRSAFRGRFPGRAFELAQLEIRNSSESHSRAVWFRANHTDFTLSQFLLERGWVQPDVRKPPRRKNALKSTHAAVRLHQIEIDSEADTQSIEASASLEWTRVELEPGEQVRLRILASTSTHRCRIRSRQTRRFTQFPLGRRVPWFARAQNRTVNRSLAGFTAHLKGVFDFRVTRPHDLPSEEEDVLMRLGPFEQNLNHGRVSARSPRFRCQGLLQ